MELLRMTEEILRSEKNIPVKSDSTGGPSVYGSRVSSIPQSMEGTSASQPVPTETMATASQSVSSSQPASSSQPSSSSQAVSTQSSAVQPQSQSQPQRPNAMSLSNILNPK
jgi:hypothetical protein